MRRHSRVWPAVCVSVLMLAGCGQTKPPVTSPEKTAPADGAPAPVMSRTLPTAATANGDQAPLVATAEEGSAEAAFQKTLIAFQDGRLDAVFEFLPASYQTDIETLVHEFAEKMDEELWNKSVNALKRIAGILKSKKSLILSLDNVKKSSQYEIIKLHWDAIAAGVQEVVTSEVTNLNQLKKCDVKRMLQVASQMLNSKGLPLPKFGDVTVTTVDASDRAATLSYRESSDSEPKQVEFVKVDGKWLPKSIAQGWSELIGEVRSKLNDLPGQLAAVKPVVIMQLEGLEGILSKLEKAKNAEEFSGAVVPLFVSIALGKGQAEQALREAQARPRKEGAIQIVINRELGESEQSKLKDAILAMADDPDVEYEIIPNDGKTRFRFTPLSSKLGQVAAVIEKSFEGAKITQEAESRTIRVELK